MCLLFRAYNNIAIQAFRYCKIELYNVGNLRHRESKINFVLKFPDISTTRLFKLRFQSQILEPLRVY